MTKAGCVRTVAFASALLAASIGIAHAQGQYDGTWKAEFTTRTGTSREGKVVISGATGKWDMASHQRNNPCVGLAYPLTVIDASDDELTFKIERAATLAGCRDGKASLKRVDEKTLEGEVDGSKLRLIRQ